MKMVFFINTIAIRWETIKNRIQKERIWGTKKIVNGGIINIGDEASRKNKISYR